jgi:hypothetical protein
MMFTLLLLGQGFDQRPPAPQFVDVATAAWDAITKTSPFSAVVALRASKPTFAAYVDYHASDLGFRQRGATIDVDPAKKNNLKSYLANATLKVPVAGEPDRLVNCLEVWPEQGRAGRTGSLVAVLVKGTQPGELYQIKAAPNYPVPVVAVVVSGDQWHKPIVRAIAQSMAHLADEFELPGPTFRKAPIQLVDPRPNVIVISDDQREKLRGGATAQQVVDIPNTWNIGPSTRVAFHPHPGEEPNVDTSRRGGRGGKLIEGAATYRFNALRCDFDCLMRRQPNSVALPIQAAGVEFCAACENAVREQINNRGSNVLGLPARIDSQAPLCDSVRWKTSTQRSTTLHLPFTLEAGTRPKWSAQVDCDPVLGLRLQAVELKDRPLDPFNGATLVFNTIGFGDLKVKFAGEPEQTLSFQAALQNTTHEPQLLELRDATSKGYLAALRMSLTWDIPGHWSIEGVLSVVFKDRATDFDPGSAAVGNKVYPQISLRYRKPTAGKGPLAKVEWLTGSIHLVTGNVFRPDMHAPGWGHMLTGTQQMVLAVDSNSSDNDSTYDWDDEEVASFGAECQGEDVPGWGLWGATWQSGRLLADVRDPSLTSGIQAFADGHVGATARKGFESQDGGVPSLPHWSWLFDCVSPLVLGPKRFVAVYGPGKKTPRGGDGGSKRQDKVRWPKPSDQVVSPRPYEMTVVKLPRQGAYDNVHVHPAMGSIDGREIVPAPFCADLCVHLHVRWGTSALGGQMPRQPGTMDRIPFLGWGLSGRLDQGAHTTLGAPLVPPNQHVEIEVNHRNTNSEIVYTATAYDPIFDAYQVFLEQGSGVLWSFGGLKLWDVARLAGATRAIDARTINKLTRELLLLEGASPEDLDFKVRHLFHMIYDRIRWYPSEDPVKPGVQQVPDKSGAGGPLEDL